MIYHWQKAWTWRAEVLVVDKIRSLVRKQSEQDFDCCLRQLSKPLPARGASQKSATALVYLEWLPVGTILYLSKIVKSFAAAILLAML